MANPENPADNFLNASKPPRLLEAVRDAIRLKHYSFRREETYVHWIRRFIHFHGKRHPRELGATEVTAFLNHLVKNRDVAAATQNQALSALLFLYREVPAEPLAWLDGVERSKRPARVPSYRAIERANRKARSPRQVTAGVRIVRERDGRTGLYELPLLTNSAAQ